MFRVLRSFLRENRWPDSLDVAVLSAKFGLIGSLAHISRYDVRMTRQRALELNPLVTASIQKLATSHTEIDLVMGKDYLESINLQCASAVGSTFRFAHGGIGMKLNRLHDLLRQLPYERRRVRKDLARPTRPLYFLPDWDDFLDVDYDFRTDAFSCPSRATRNEEHSIALMRPHRLCDGVLVSLAQHLGTKGLLKRIEHTNSAAFAPRSVRKHFKLEDDQWAFGDCGAFSYVSEEVPTISVEQAVSVYDLYEFDYGASVDHIPALQIMRDEKKFYLSQEDRARRIRLTRSNAEKFIAAHREVRARFTPVGVIQGLTPAQFARQIGDYVDMGYTHLALGGLVPRTDGEILEIVQAVHGQIIKLSSRPWLHLLGVFRPSLQTHFRRFGVNSFDSATYFRKAWLRSDQNYLGSDGKWYAAIRVPPSRDARTLLRLKQSDVTERRIRNLEVKALSTLHDYDRGSVSINECLKAIRAYDSLLPRAEALDIGDGYRLTLEAKPWKTCTCAVCRTIGIDVIIFRGLNRNKRRGAHNTLQLYHQLTGVKRVSHGGAATC